MNLKQVQYMLVLAKSRSFSEASETLGISQPSLSQYVKKIEQQYGQQLIDRSAGEIRLTDAGQVYVEIGRKIVDLEQQLKNRFDDLAQYQAGSIRVGISPHRSVCLMPGIAAAFKQEYPGMNVVLDERVRSELLDGAAQGDFDLFVTTLPVDEGRFVHEPVMREEIVLAIPRSMPICARVKEQAKSMPGRAYPAVDLRVMADADFVFLGEEQLMQQHLTQLCSQLDMQVRRAVECRSIEAQLAMVRAGIGAALIPSGAARFERTDGVDFFSLQQDVPKRDIVVAWRKEAYLTRAMRRFIEIMVEKMQ